MQRTAMRLLVTCYCALIVGAFSTSAHATSRLFSWAEGAAQYESARKSASQRREPLLVYFYSDACSACEQLNRDYFGQPDVRRFLIKINKVSVNPGHGPAARRLFERFGAKRRPSLYLTFPGTGRSPIALRPFDGSAKAFPTRVASSVARSYDHLGSQLNEAGRFAEARRALLQALSYDEDNVPALYNLGRSYHLQGKERSNPELLARAEDCYRRVVALAPNHRGSRAGLRQLRVL